MGGGLTPALWDCPPWEGRVGNPPPTGKRTEPGHGVPLLLFLEGQHIPVAVFPTKNTADRRQKCWVSLLME